MNSPDTVNNLLNFVENEGKQVRLTYSDGESQIANVDKVLVEERCASTFLTFAGEGDQCVCLYRAGKSGRKSLEFYRDQEVIENMKTGDIKTPQQQPINRSLVEVTGKEGS